jgi:hypothetical protein
MKSNVRPGSETVSLRRHGRRIAVIRLSGTRIAFP